MRRSDLEHIIRAAAGVTGEKEFIVIGSQAILGQYPEAPEALLISMEADLYAADRPDLSDLISGSLGWESRFDTTFGYHADGVGPGTATLPAEWERRLTGIRNANTDGATGWCIEAHDIAVAKYVAGREKDLRYNREMWKAGLLDAATIERRLAATELDDGHRARVAATIRRHQRKHGTATRTGPVSPATPGQPAASRARAAPRAVLLEAVDQQGKRRRPATRRGPTARDSSHER